MERILRLAAVQDLLNGEDLKAGVGGAVRGFVESGLGGFFQHGFGGLFKAEEDAEVGFFAGEDGSYRSLFFFLKAT